MSFNDLNLHENITRAIEICGYTKPTPIQKQAVPAILQGRDVVASAQTGTGKTAAFVLPALHYLNSQEPTKQTRILILTPTRELAAQITKAAGLYGKFSRYNIVSLVGGMSYHTQIRDLQRGADIIVATPGRLLDHIEQRRVNLSNIDMLILDEADRMLDMGFIDDVEYIAKLTPKKRQTLLFSATVDKKLATTIRHLLNDPVRIDLSNEKMAAPAIKQELYKVSSPHQKQRVLKQFLNDSNIFKAIIFSATKINADRIAEQLQNDGFSAGALHGDLRQNVRTRMIEELRRGKIQYLVATDVAARGIDISDITHVINYDFPKFSEDYVHRIGRTGRAGKDGVAISFILPSDLRHVQGVERYIGQRLPMLQINTAGEIVKSQDDGLSVLPFDRSRDDKKGRGGRSGAPRGRSRDDNGSRFAHERNDSRGGDASKRKRSGGDKPFGGRSFGDKPFGDKPYAKRSSRSDDRGDRGDDSSGGNSGSGAPKRKRFGGSDRPFGDKPAFDDKPFARRSPRGDDRDRSSAPRGDAPARKRFGGDRPFADKPAFGDKPFAKRGPRSDDRSSAPRGDAPARKRFGSDKPFGDKPAYSDKPFAKRSAYGSDRGDAPRGDAAPKRKRFSGDKPFGDKPAGERTFVRPTRKWSADKPKRDDSRG